MKFSFKISSEYTKKKIHEIYQVDTNEMMYYRNL